MLVELDEKQIQLILQVLNFKLDQKIPMSEEDIAELNKAQVKLYETVQRHNRRY
tara:strand:- start:323 stop:484 length:162 start_codon:yes stop_codon:yes gene_type:complete